MPLPFPSPYSFLHPLILKFVNDVLTFWFRVFFAVTNSTSRNSILYSEAEGERWFCPARHFGMSAECLGSRQARPILALQYLWQRERVPPWASRASAIFKGRSHSFRRTNGVDKLNKQCLPGTSPPAVRARAALIVVLAWCRFGPASLAQTTPVTNVLRFRCWFLSCCSVRTPRVRDPLRPNYLRPDSFGARANRSPCSPVSLSGSVSEQGIMVHHQLGRGLVSG